MRTLILICTLLGPQAWAGDGNALDFDVGSAPDLLEVFRHDGPVMGQCPMGDRAKGALRPQEHLLHLGTTGYYLDYENTLGLSKSQVTKLVGIRDSALAKGATLDVRVRLADEAVWKATAAAPSLDDVERLVRTVEQIRAERRLTYIRSIAEASKVLSPVQLETLTGRRAGE